MKVLRACAVDLLSAGFEAIGLLVLFGALITLSACLPVTLCFLIVWDTLHPLPPRPSCANPAPIAETAR